MRIHESDLLKALSHTEWTPSRALAKATKCPRTSVTAILGRLRDAGLVERRGNGVIGDGYEWRLPLG